MSVLPRAMSLSPLKHKEVQLVDDLRSLQVSSAKQKIAATATSSKSPSASYSSAKEHITQAKKAIRSVLEQHEEYIHLTAVDQEPACDLWSEVGKFVLDLIKLNKPTRPNARTKALVFRVAAIKQYLRKLKKNSAKPPQALRVLRQLMEAAEGLNSLEAELEKRNAQELAAEMGLRYLDLRLSRPTIAVLDREIKKQELLRLNSNMEEEKDSDSNTDSLGETSTTCCPSSSSAAVDYHFREKDLDSDSDSDSDSLDETSKTPYCSPASLVTFGSASLCSDFDSDSNSDSEDSDWHSLNRISTSYCPSTCSWTTVYSGPKWRLCQYKARCEVRRISGKVAGIVRSLRPRGIISKCKGGGKK